jgi:chemotaxis protein methyltransferase CheR
MNARAELQRWLSDTTGIELSRGGVVRCLDEVIERRCRELGCSEPDYVRIAHDVNRREFELLANAITVVYTWFFRDRGQMAALESAMQQRRAQHTGPLRIWVAGCATGEDCFSIAMLAERLGIAVSILGTDINTAALDRARQGRYVKATLREVDDSMLRHFTRQSDGTFLLSPRIRELSEFAHHNLSTRAPEPAPGQAWDLILCRNVLIYFKPERALAVFEGMARSLAPDGLILLGASEVVYDVPDELSAVYHAGRLVLQRSNRAASSTRRAVSAATHEAPHRPPLPVFPSVVSELTADRISGVPPPALQSEHLQRGHEQLDAGCIAEALQHYGLAVASDPTWPDAQMYRGVARYLSSDVEGAAQDLRAALFLDGQLWQAAFYLALSYESMGLSEAALREYRHVVTLCERLPKSARVEHPLLVAWQGDVLELARRRVHNGGARAS